jgi:hypothetical protein
LLDFGITLGFIAGQFQSQQITFDLQNKPKNTKRASPGSCIIDNLWQVKITTLELPWVS